jgi:aminomethyltransferase
VQRLVRFDKAEFLGCEALLRQQSQGVTKQLVGLKMEVPGIPRHGYTLWSGEQQIGVVTSGTQSPTLGVGIALGYVSLAYATVGAAIEVEIRGKRAPARVTSLPFYLRKKE